LARRSGDSGDSSEQPSSRAAERAVGVRRALSLWAKARALLLALHPLQVARRIFPVGRGLYEDYLSNFWCTTSVAVKWRVLFPGPALMPVCAGVTLLAAAPSVVQQVVAPSPRGLLLGMANSAAAFFMFGFQVRVCVRMCVCLCVCVCGGGGGGGVCVCVGGGGGRREGGEGAFAHAAAALGRWQPTLAPQHDRTQARPHPTQRAPRHTTAPQVHEKSILLPLLPLSMLAASEPDLALWGPVVGAFQMYPLLVRTRARARVCFPGQAQCRACLPCTPLATAP
jgi:hypothetical protein